MCKCKFKTKVLSMRGEGTFMCTYVGIIHRRGLGTELWDGGRMGDGR